MSKREKAVRPARKKPIDPVSMRLDAPLLEALRTCARQNCRSVSAEIKFRLFHSFEHKHGVIVVPSLPWTSENPRGDHS